MQGKRGERFVYLTWGNVGGDGSFKMFRRAKVMFGQIDATLVRNAAGDGATLVGRVRLSDRRGQPLCARVVPRAIEWRAERVP